MTPGRMAAATLAAAGLALAVGAVGPARGEPAPATRAAQARPAITGRWIPYPERRRREMAAYAGRHYGVRTARLAHPRVIVEHLTDGPSVASAYEIFARDVPDAELHELPATCAHFIVDRDGRIYQLVSIRLMCRHAVGLNDVAIGIEHVGSSDGDLLGNAAMLRSSLALTAWLRCRLRIGVANVIGHAESLSSRYHHERVARLRTQTHDDLHRAAMQVYRERLRAMPACGAAARAPAGTVIG